MMPDEQEQSVAQIAPKGFPPPLAPDASTADQAPVIHIVKYRGRFRVIGPTSLTFGPPLGPNSSGWACWSWDGNALTAENCRYGIRPLFYFATADQVAVAGSIRSLLILGAPAEIDRAALSVYLRFENFLAEDTPFKYIKALPPGARLRWSGSLTLSTSEYRPALLNITREHAVRRYGALFRSAVRRQAAERNIVPLSGGCDSRHIALELAGDGRSLRSISAAPFPPKSNDDMEIAGRVAAAIGIDHETVEQDVSRYNAITRTTQATSYCGREHAWFRRLAKRLIEMAGPDTAIFDGLGGDVLSAGLFLDERTLDLFRTGRLQELACHYLSGQTGPLPFLADPDIAPATLAVERLEAELARHQSAPNPVGAFFFWNRTRRVVAQQFFGLVADQNVVTPYLDPELFDFLAALPAEMYLDHQFHRDAMHRAHPGFAHIGFARPSAKQRAAGQRAHFRAYGRSILRLLATQPCHTVNRHYAEPRIRYLSCTGDRGACWTADACLYLSQLEHAASAHTHHYRCYFLDRFGNTVDGTAIQSLGDVAAIEQSMVLLAARAQHSIELWNRDRLTFRYVSDDHDLAGSLPNSDRTIDCA